VNITIGPRSAGEAAGLADSWANRIRRALAERHPRFEITRHDWQDTGDGQPPRLFWRSLSLGPAGYPLYKITLNWQAAQPEILSVDLTPIESSESGPLKKPFKWLGTVAGVGLIGWWLYYAIFEADWRRVLDILTTIGDSRADRGYLFSAILGWGLAPISYIALVMIGEWLDEKINWLVRPGRQRYIDTQLEPWLGKFISETAGSPVPEWPNVVYAASGDMRPAPGYTWASDDPNSREVRPVPQPDR